MKKEVKYFCILFLILLSFSLGWRVMPKVWPGIKENIVYRMFPDMKPEPAPEPEPYVPESNTSFGDLISETDSVIYYFYKDYCPYCREIEPLMAGLPQHITLPDGTKNNIRLICLNKVEDRYLKIITNYYEEHKIPEEEQYVPAVVVGDQYLFPGDDIVDHLLDSVVKGDGLQTPLLNGSERVP